jgi:hypothetical protein
MDKSMVITTLLFLIFSKKKIRTPILTCVCNRPN